MTYKDFSLGDWIGHISGVIEDESELDGNEMRDLLDFLTKLPRIPDNATNGDVIKALFPKAEITENKYYDGTISHYTVCFVGEGGLAIYNIFLDSWWNAPYKREGEQK